MTSQQQVVYFFLIFLGLISSSLSASSGICSFHEAGTCDEKADCVQKDEGNSFDCVCHTGYFGDGYQNGTGCTDGRNPCVINDECHTRGECEDNFCVCRHGFKGDGYDVCEDINECECSGETCMCDENAYCTNTIGNFTCQCKNNYRGDGYSCSFFCSINADCHADGRCQNEACICRNGYEGDGRFNCTDINECALPPYPCSVDADCANTDGSYECECKNGYTGNGKDCTAMPRTCDEIFKTKPKSADGLYIIDPDGPDALPKVEVYCDFMPDMGVTIMNPKTEMVQVNRNKPEYSVEYEQQIPEIEAVADNSGFCFQLMSAKCRYLAKMLDGDDYWVDRKNNSHYTWGGAKTTGKCVCGQIGACPNPESNCVCDGTVNGQIDDGKIIEKDQLPIRKVHIGGLTGSEKIDIILGPVTCGPKPFGFPIDCYEAKFSGDKIKKDGPLIIDVDGPDGPANPILVQCDMESYPHVGITVIVHDQPGPTPPNTPIEYAGNNGDISKIIEKSAFCRQDVTYDCQDSPIMANGNTQIVDIDGNVKDYYPGGLPGRCACGLTGTCFDNTKQCNCDTVDGVRRQDFGPVTNKGDLPVGSITSVDPGNNSTVTLGPLMCSRREFGFEANCEVLLQKGSDVSYTYWIDPDGPSAIDAVDTENVAPFPAQCVMVKEPPHGVTIIHHENENYETLEGSLVLNYYYVSALQFQKLRKRSVFCTQAVSFQCTTSPIFEGGAPNIEWYDIEGDAHSYFNGNGSKDGCACALTGTCDGGAGSLCNCDKNDAQKREDVGNLILKDDLPAAEVKGFGPSINVGPLKCYDTFPTCSDLFAYMYFHRFENEAMVKNGEYTINPDGAGGVESFKVTCQFPKTEIPILPGTNTNGTESPDGTDPITKCFDINYGNGITKEQVQALIDNSKTCVQELVYNCVNAPVTDRVHYDTCDGNKQPGFAGSNGEDMCACGVTGTCASLSGEVNECNCAIQDGQQRSDGGMIRDKSRLPVCEVCMTIDPVNPQQPSRSASYEVSSLKCSDYNIGVFGSCQARRESTNSPQPSDTVYIDPDGYDKGNPPFPIFCEILAHPPAGIVTIYPKKETNPVPGEGGMIIVDYYVYILEYMKVVVSEAVFCEQEVYVLCNGAQPPTQRGSYDEWIVTNDGTIQCKEGACSCSDGQIHGGFVKVQSSLPVIAVILDKSTADRKVHIGPLKCYDLYKDCHDIKVNKAITNSAQYRGNKYAVDPDGPGGVEFFEVTCDFKTDPSIGITIIPGQPDSIKVEGQTGPGSQVTDIVYPDVTPEQINVLTKQSGFCSQGIQYECKETALINNNSPADGFYTTYGGVQSSSFGTGFQSDVTGCACVLTGTCPPGTNCHCDAKGPMVAYDYGILTDTNVMPIVQLNLGGQSSPGATATATVGDVRCGPTPFDLPKDCEEVYKNGFQKSGEFMIYPTTDTKPYMVYCDMEIVPGHGVTVVGHDHEEPTVTEGTVTETVTYNNASSQQVDGLTDVSQYCYQPIKYDCYNTHFIGYGKFYWTGTGGQSKYYLGTGSSGCSCSGGIDKLCGGDNTRSVLETRKCSCDAGELQWRSDAGVFTNNLPVVSMTFLDSGRVNATGKITLGKLFCSQVEFDLNECDTGFNDCHEHATCTNKDGTFECNCKPGYQGKKVSGVYANGRNCYDDNECALGWCPHSAECENIPGSFKCKCKPGYTQELPEECGGYQQCKAVCKDIDECADPKKNNCSENAVCTNLQGSYSCRCKRGYRGDGVECIPVGLCTCFGDPHCISYDSKFLHYQGDCQYVMSQDGCNGTDQTFKVLTKHWNKNIVGIEDATWVEKVIFTFPGHVVELGQDHELKVDGLKRSVPVKTDNMLAQRRGKWIEVRTTIGVNVNWDGFEKVEVKVPPNYQDKMCGLCGNYNSNPADDWTLGPACAGQGTITNNPNKFGNSFVDVSYKDANPQCSFDCNQPPPSKEPCTGMDMTLSKFYCDKVFDMNGKFKTCLEKMDIDGVLKSFYSTCIFDECKVTENRELVMCAIAENIVKECQDNYDTVISDWRTQEMCSPSCPVNMEYLTCGSEDRMRTCENTTTIETDSYEKCTADCYCKENMFLDGNKCVEYEQCGCLYNGFYYSVGEFYTDQECTTMSTCQSDRSFTSRPLTCSENATCGLDKDTGVYGCYCKQGFMGDGEKCEFNPCGTNPCNPNENCVVKGESYICECQMGFQGECNNCQDIDECATKTDECPPHSRCKNTVGSYTCQCIEGYQKDNERCKDINECKIGTATCGDGTKCMNKPGSFACEPCSAGSPDGKCCVCYGGKCNIPGEVCGTDGVTYSSEGDLIVARCEKGKKIGLNYRGPCLDSCPGENSCPGMQTCNISEETGKPECTCPPCSPEEVVSEVKVCSSTLDIYSNICSFKKIQCALDREDTIIENTIAPCEEKKGLEVVTEWSEWSPCSVTCGNGTMTRDRQAMAEFDDFLTEKYPLNQASGCYKPPCVGSSCEGINCNTSQVCVESETGEGFCVCPDCTDHGEDPVCGKIGSQYTKTYKNPCELSKQACDEGEPYEELYAGTCGTQPLNCTKMPRLETIRNDEGCLSERKVNLGKCDGGCGPYANLCCKPITKQVDVELVCKDQTTGMKKVDIIEDCECESIPVP